VALCVLYASLVLLACGSLVPCFLGFMHNGMGKV
jgi:hypothetical protein